MADLPNPNTIIAQLNADAEKVGSAEIRTHLLDAAQSMGYLLILLKECTEYIEGVKEYPDPPRFLKAVEEVLKK